jgi:putative DNA primase/helicase
VNSENAKFLIQFLDDLERENRDSIPVVRSIGRMGWIGKNAFLPGAEGDIELDVDETSGAASVAGAYKECGSFEHWVKEMGEIRRSYPLARFMLSASFAAPLLRIVGQRVFIVHAWGPSRGGKTAALKAALSVWGNAEELIASFNATRVGLERMASFYGDLPLGVDERQVVGDKQGFVEGLVYMLGSGRGKVRGAKGGGLQQVQSWRTIVLTTGEQPLSTGSSNAGIKTRTLELYGKPIDDEDLASKLHDTTRDIYGLAGPRFVRQLIDTFGEDGEKLKQEYDTFKGLLSKQFASNSSSHVQAVATVALADYYASQWIFMQDEEEAVTQALDLAELALGQLETAADADDGQRAYEFFISWYGVHRANFEGDRALQRYGRIDHSDINLLLVYPHIFEEALTEGGFNPDRILRDWADRGWLEQQAGKDGQKRMKIRRRDDGRLTYFVGVRLPREAYEE